MARSGRGAYTCGMTRTLLAAAFLALPVSGFAVDLNTTAAQEVAPKKVRKPFDARQVCLYNCNAARVDAEKSCKGMNAASYSVCMKTADDQAKSCKALCPASGSSTTTNAATPAAPAGN